MRKILSIFLIVLLMTAIVPAFFVQKAEATHTADVFWNDDGNGLLITNTTKALESSLATGFIANFSIHNRLNVTLYEGDYIGAVRVVLGSYGTGIPLFNFVRGEVYKNTTTAVPNWIADPSQFESGRARTVTFRAMPENEPDAPLIAGDTYWFIMYFDAGPSTCNYPDAFKVYTEDSGLRLPGEVAPSEPIVPQTKLSGTLGIIIDTELPAITTVPVNGTIVNGSIVPCGQHYFNISSSSIS
ncbi:hypothetical protein MUP59_05970 [Candidatus Bathyarchaeota archaeon]|nr:hypothetical protein [Candidatus Bathyarchaeota archaeon]